MELLITYDVNTTTREGQQQRLRRVAKACEGFGHRVQQSVFEVVCSPAQLLTLEAELLNIINISHDSIRFYRLHHGTFASAQHLGAAVNPPHRGAIII
jgi:CRISPR-associated protein Cas2